MGKWDTEPSASDLRAPRQADEAPARHTRRRSTKLWCRGKVGVEHIFEVRLTRSVAGRLWQPHKYGRDRYQYLNGCHCEWSWWLWRLYDDWKYRCAHERYCTSCGKIFPLEPKDCPEYDSHPKPMISAREAEDQYRRQRLVERASRQR